MHAITNSGARSVTFALASLALSAMTLLVFAPSAFAGTASLEDGISEAMDSACEIAVSEGEDLLDAQADAVGAKLAALTDQNAAENAAAAQAKSAQAQAQMQTPQTSQTATQEASGPNTIDVAGSAMHYTDTHLATTAPSTGAGLWMGSDSTTDNDWGYFIGHNPGPFWHVMDLGMGDAITVTDGAGNARTYHVVDAFTVSDSTAWEQIEDRVTGHGESVILQTCCGDHANYRIVVAE